MCARAVGVARRHWGHLGEKEPERRAEDSALQGLTCLAALFSSKAMAGEEVWQEIDAAGHGALRGVDGEGGS